MKDAGCMSYDSVPVGIYVMCTVIIYTGFSKWSGGAVKLDDLIGRNWLESLFLPELWETITWILVIGFMRF